MISPGLADKLREYYVGKICTIITKPMALPLDKSTHPHWFTIMVDDIDREVIVGTEISRRTKQLFFFPIMGIVEEQVISPNHPDYDKVKQKMERTIAEEQNIIRQQSMSSKPSPMHSLAPQPIDTTSQISIDKIQQQAAELKKKWSTSSVEGVKNEDE